MRKTSKSYVQTHMTSVTKYTKNGVTHSGRIRFITSHTYANP